MPMTEVGEFDCVDHAATGGGVACVQSLQKHSLLVIVRFHPQGHEYQSQLFVGVVLVSVQLILSLPNLHVQFDHATN